MYLGLILLILVQAINVQALNYEWFGEFAIDQRKANYLITRAEAGLIALRLKIKLLGSPEFLIGKHIEEIETDNYRISDEYPSRPLTDDHFNVKFLQDNTATTYLMNIGSGRAVCVSTNDLLPTLATWNTGALTCAVLRVASKDCNGPSYQEPMVGVGIGSWEDNSLFTESVFIYCGW